MIYIYITSINSYDIMMYYYYLLFINKETEVQRESNLPNIIMLGSSKARDGT